MKCLKPGPHLSSSCLYLLYSLILCIRSHPDSVSAPQIPTDGGVIADAYAASQRKSQTSSLNPQPHTAIQASNHNWLGINESQKLITLLFQTIWRHRQHRNHFLPEFRQPQDFLHLPVPEHANAISIFTSIQSRLYSDQVILGTKSTQGSSLPVPSIQPVLQDSFLSVKA